MCAAQVVAGYLNEHGLAAKGQATWQMPGVLQRSTSIFASEVDISEAYQVGRKAVEIAMNDGTGYMSTIVRKSLSPYTAGFDKMPLARVANSVRHLPASWLTKDGLDVTDDFIDYARPLIGESWPAINMNSGMQRFAQLEIKFIDKKLPPYLPVNWRQ